MAVKYTYTAHNVHSNHFYTSPLTFNIMFIKDSSQTQAKAKIKRHLFNLQTDYYVSHLNLLYALKNILKIRYMFNPKETVSKPLTIQYKH